MRRNYDQAVAAKRCNGRLSAFVGNVGSALTLAKNPFALGLALLMGGTITQLSFVNVLEIP